MKRTFLTLLSLLTFISCNSEEPENEMNTHAVEVTIETLPVMDSSTSTQPLITILSSHLLDIPYIWYMDVVDCINYAKLDYSQSSITDSEKEVLKSKLNCSTTHGSYTNLINRKVDLIIASRYSSRDENSDAEMKGIALIQKPIAKDAFAFIVNPKNKVRNLTIEQIQKIYTGEITNWKEVGGNDAKIDAFIRDANSGSQEKMETMVMAGLTMIQGDEMTTHGMAGPYYSIYRDENGIAYTPFYYYNIMASGMKDRAVVIDINGVEANEANIINGSYPYISEIYAAIRADEPEESMARILFDFLTTSAAATIIKESGYIPLEDAKSSISSSKAHSRSANMYDLNGRKQSSKPLRGVYVQEGKKIHVR